VDEAAGHSEINKASKTGHSFDSSLPSLDGLATVLELRMSSAALDRFRVAGAVKAAGLAAVGSGVLTAL
jgi:hypothetical protein